MHRRSPYTGVMFQGGQSELDGDYPKFYFFSWNKRNTGAYKRYLSDSRRISIFRVLKQGLKLLLARM
jgi:hypothetical protein